MCGHRVAHRTDVRDSATHPHEHIRRLAAEGNQDHARWRRELPLDTTDPTERSDDQPHQHPQGLPPRRAQLAGGDPGASRSEEPGVTARRAALWDREGVGRSLVSVV